MGFDGIMSNEHDAAYLCMKPSVNIDAVVISKVTKRAKIAMLGNVIAVNHPVKMAGEIAMVDCISGGRIISGFVPVRRWRPSMPESAPRKTGTALRRPTT